MHKCNSVQFVSRQRGALFVASREFCGGLTACFFLVFRLTVKIFRGFTATSAKIWLGIWQLRLGAWAHWMGDDLSVHLCMHVCVQAFQWRHSPTSLPSISLVIFLAILNWSFWLVCFRSTAYTRSSAFVSQPGSRLRLGSIVHTRGPASIGSAGDGGALAHWWQWPNFTCTTSSPFHQQQIPILLIMSWTCCA